jgi:DNA polymerase-3 subunit delta
MTPARDPGSGTKGKRGVHLLWGEDAFLLRDAALEIMGPEPAVREIEAAEWQGGETADLATPSLFGEPRALLVTDCRHLPEMGLAELGSYLGAPSPDALLLLCATVGERAKAPTALVKLVEPVGRVREVKVARKDLPAWVVRRGAAKDVDISPDGAGALIARVGEDTGALDQAIDQLGSAFPGERIAREAVGRQFDGLGDQHIWDLCDRAFARDLPGSMRTVVTLLEAGQAGLPILGGIASRLRDLLRVKAQPDGMTPAELARAAGLRFDWQARRYRDQVRHFSMQELLDVHERVVEADRALKSGGDEDVVLSVLVAAIAASA